MTDTAPAPSTSNGVPKLTSVDRVVRPLSLSLASSLLPPPLSSPPLLSASRPPPQVFPLLPVDLDSSPH